MKTDQDTARADNAQVAAKLSSLVKWWWATVVIFAVSAALLSSSAHLTAGFVFVMVTGLFLTRLGRLIRAVERLDARVNQLTKKNETLEAALEGEKRLSTEYKIKSTEGVKLKNLGILAGTVAHDLNNILSGIATLPEVLLMDVDPGSNLAQGLNLIKDSGRKASSVVSDLLTISRGIKADRQLLNINTVAERYMASAEFQKILNTYPGVDIEVDLAPELLNMTGAYLHIEKAMMNLVLNAVEETASIEGGRVCLSTANYYVDEAETVPDPNGLEPGEYVMLSVADNGKGIPEAFQDQIFDPFFTQKQMGKSGTGLGLTVVLNAVQDHDGIIQVNSRDTGTRFDVYFPAVRCELPQNDHEADCPQNSIMGSKAYVLLVVDDLATQRKIAATLLRKLGYTVFTADSGDAALDFVKTTPVDLLVLDMIMPRSISGLETYVQIKKMYPNQKAIIASGHSPSKDVKKAQELGAGRFVKKPYTMMDMGSAVKEELQR